MGAPPTRAAFVVRKVLAVWVSRAVSGSFDCGAHGEAVSTFAQDDRVWGRVFGWERAFGPNAKCGGPSLRLRMTAKNRQRQKRFPAG